MSTASVAHGSDRRDRADTIPALTGVRAIAAGMVFFFHYVIQSTHFTHWHPVFRGLVEAGALGVSVFFALSGFLITMRYYEDFQHKRITFGNYWLRRFFRIFPLYAFVLTFFVVIPAWQPLTPERARELAVNYTLTQAFFTDLVLTGTITAWSLTLEEIFYLLAPWLMFRLAPKLNGRARSVIVRAVVVCAIAEIIGVLFTQLPPIIPNTWFGAPHWYIRESSIFGRLSDFVAGMACAIVWLNARNVRISFSRSQWLMIVGVTGALLASVTSFIVSPNSLTLERHVLHTSFGVFSALFILGLAWDRERRAWLTQILGGPVMVYLGKISYAMFLIQITPVAVFIHARLLDPFVLPSTRVAAMYVILTAISIVLYEFIEHPIHRWATQKLTRSRSLRLA